MEINTTSGRVNPSDYFKIDEGSPYTSLDKCDFRDWRDETSTATFAVHDLGFAVFLRPTEITKFDEYVVGDPYGVLGQAGEPTAFHQRRLDCTLQLLQEVIGEQKATNDQRLLDVACGAGHITGRIRDRFPNVRISALDCSLTAISSAVKQYPGIDFVVADAYAPPFPPAEFDVVVLNNIWEHVPDPLRLLAAVDRVLKPDGRVIISTPSRYRLGNLLRVLAGRRVQLISKHHVTEYSVGQVFEQLRFAGYTATMLDMPVNLPASTISSFVIRRALGPLLRLYCRATGSRHSLEWTVFYSAYRRKD